MEFNLHKTIEVLEKTPTVLEYLLRDSSPEWHAENEGDESFSPYDVIGHLIHGEKSDWVIRMKIILGDSEEKSFAPYDRFAQFTESEGKSLNDLLTEFKIERNKNISYLISLRLTETDLNKTGIHPKFGEVTLRELLATWTVHDLSHLAQIARVMAKQYKSEVGPWEEYLPILNR